MQDTVKVKRLEAGKAPMGAIYTKSKHSIDATHNLNQPVAGRHGRQRDRKHVAASARGTQTSNTEHKQRYEK